jgi:NAD(P)-dependent dehydrogenase (short-subunit alcohol dehydrogenase family)
MSAPELPERLRAAAELLEAIARDRTLLEVLTPGDRERLMRAVAGVYNPDPAARRARLKAAERERSAARTRRDDEALHKTGIRVLRAKPVFTTPNVFPPQQRPEVEESADQRHCYVCKQKITAIHHFYDQMCLPCAEFNFAKRTELADLKGRVALLTGGRVKIGYQAGLKLLRCGAHLIVTTRFPRDSARRYAQEPDFGEWGHRLEIFGLDLRHTPSVEAFCRELLVTRERIDFIVNNACQTVRRPPEFYAHMMEGERAALPSHAEKLLPVPRAQAPGLTQAPELSQLRLLAEEFQVQKHLFPEGRLDQDLQQVDLRSTNSWRFLMHEVPSVELLEVHLVNAIAPFVLNARLKPLMLRVPTRDKHIVNVSAMEGQFYRKFKTTRHPHTNMAKAALNMMTRTSATDY